MILFSPQKDRKTERKTDRTQWLKDTKTERQVIKIEALTWPCWLPSSGVIGWSVLEWKVSSVFNFVKPLLRVVLILSNKMLNVFHCVCSLKISWLQLWMTCRISSSDALLASKWANSSMVLWDFWMFLVSSFFCFSRFSFAFFSGENKVNFPNTVCSKVSRLTYPT